MKSLLKGILVVTLIGVMLVNGAVLAFAEETREGGKLEREQLTKEEVRERQDARLNELFTTYYPEGLNAYLEIKTAHELFHETAKAERELHKESIKEQFQSIKASVENGDMTREEAKPLIEALRETMQDFRSQVEVIIEAKKAEAEGIREELIAIRESIKDELEAEIINDGTVKGLLESLLVQLNVHLEMDIQYYNQIKELEELMF